MKLDLTTPPIDFGEEFQRQKQEERSRKIWGCGVKPVCANCKHLVEDRHGDYTCEPRRGIIPKEIADNLTCVRSPYPNFEARKEQP